MSVNKLLIGVYVLFVFVVHKVWFWGSATSISRGWHSVICGYS